MPLVETAASFASAPALVTPVIWVVRVDIAPVQPMELEFKEGDRIVVVCFRN
jgi:hypothetical protein